MFNNPPKNNGIMTLTAEQITDIKTKLETIKAGFTPTEEEPMLTIHGMVSRYNETNEPINGDTAQYCLKYEVI